MACNIYICNAKDIKTIVCAYNCTEHFNVVLKLPNTYVHKRCTCEL